MPPSPAAPGPLVVAPLSSVMRSTGVTVTVALAVFLLAFRPQGDPGFMRSGEFYPLALALVAVAIGCLAGAAALVASAVGMRHRIGLRAALLALVALLFTCGVAASLMVQALTNVLSTLPEATGSAVGSAGADARTRIVLPAAAAVACLVAGPLAVGVALAGRRITGTVLLLVVLVAGIGVSQTWIQTAP